MSVEGVLYAKPPPSPGEQGAGGSGKRGHPVAPLPAPLGQGVAVPGHPDREGKHIRGLRWHRVAKRHSSAKCDGYRKNGSHNYGTITHRWHDLATPVF